MKKMMLILMLFYVSFSCAEEIVDSKESINSQDPFIGAWTIQGDRSSFSRLVQLHQLFLAENQLNIKLDGR